MVVLKTNVINYTTVRIELKQGSANLYQKLHTLQPKGTKGSTYTIKLESATTYREYWCAMQPGSAAQPRLIFSSDDCGEYKEVIIVQKGGEYTWTGTQKRVHGDAAADAVATPAPAADAVATPAPAADAVATPAPAADAVATPAPAADVVATPAPDGGRLSRLKWKGWPFT